MTIDPVTHLSHNTPDEPEVDADFTDPSEHTPDAGTDPSDLLAATPTPSRFTAGDPPMAAGAGAPPRTGRAGFKNHPPSSSGAPQKFTVVLSQKQTLELARTVKRVHRLRDSCERLALRLRNARLRVEQESKRATSGLLGLVADMGALEKQVKAQMGPQKRRVAGKKKSAKKSGGDE